MKWLDAMVIGAGPAGAAAAGLLARAGWSVAIVEKAPFPRRKVCGEFISATSLPLLRALGVERGYVERAGPPVRQVGLYCGKAMLAADMPRAPQGPDTLGRALGREHFDGLLLQAAVDAGAQLWQPWSLTALEKAEQGFCGTLLGKDRRESARLQARIVVAAHGSWEHGALPTQTPDAPARASDLFAFKAHFLGASLPAGLMPLLAFAGGYGGMVHADGGRVSLSCCIRRDMLARSRRSFPRVKAADAVIAYIRAACRGVDAALTGATRDGAWLSAGPIRPGVRPFRDDGIFAVGNAAGEAHPIVAEGISMALQSAWLLCDQLIAHQDEVVAGSGKEAVAHAYASAWRRNFLPRVRAAAVFAQLAMRPLPATIITAALQRVPALLTLGAALSGKTRALSVTQRP
ncbi:MAG: FAD-dependent monooxygenase [Burkholderiales bacterium]